MPPGNKGEVKIYMDGEPSIKPPTNNGDVKIDMDGKPDIKTPSGTKDVKLDVSLDHRGDVNLPDGNHPQVSLPNVSGPSVDLPDGRPSGTLPGADANVVIRSPGKPDIDGAGPSSLVSRYYNSIFLFSIVVQYSNKT